MMVDSGYALWVDSNATTKIVVLFFAADVL